MDRDAAFKLASDLADAGYSCAVQIGVHPSMAPQEYCSVTASLLGTKELGPLIEIANDRQLMLRVGGEISFHAASEHPRQ